LIDSLGCWLADQGHRVAVICVDPSSPFRGGALLGDRIRFTNLGKRKGVFIRSMATRGHLGGMAAAAADVLRLLEAGGYDVVLIETVGVGQTEVEVVGLADTVVLVTVPGLGDQVQVAKAGIMEIGHVFVVNKADRPEADQTVQTLRNDIAQYHEGDWVPPVVPTVASRGEGIGELGIQVMDRHRHLTATGELQAMHEARRSQSFGRLVEKTFGRIFAEYLESNDFGQRIKRDVEKGRIDVYDASSSVWGRMLEHLSSESRSGPMPPRPPGRRGGPTRSVTRPEPRDPYAGVPRGGRRSEIPRSKEA
jgi:LAO/AO transport system kinase